MEQETVYNYRGFSIPVFYDDDSQSYFINWEDEMLGLGSYNTEYEAEIRYLVDEKLDIIHVFDYGAKLEWFQNGWGGNRDIRLLYRTRLVKVWLVEKPEQVNLEDLVSESEKIIRKLEDFRIKSSSGTYIDDIIPEKV